MMSYFNLENSEVDTGLENVSFHSNPKERQCQRSSDYHTITLKSQASKAMLKFSKPVFNSTWTVNFQMLKLVLEKAEESEIKYQHPLDHPKSKRVPEKHLLLLYWLCQSLWLCGSPETVENSERDGNTRPPDLPPEKSGQEATVRTGHGTTDCFQIRKGVCQGCILSPCLFNLYSEYIMRNVRLNEAQAGIKIAGRNINNLRYADDTTLMAESKEELKSSWWK